MSGYRGCVDDDCPPGLVRVDTSAPGFTRRRRGRGFSYHDPSGARVSDRGELDRITSLAIPLAWQEVWICPEPNRHIQAVSTDAAGRRKYRYHPEWRQAREAIKHERVLTLGSRLAGARPEISVRMRTDGMGPDKVLATAVRLLDLGVFWDGGDEYAPGDDDDDDGTFGLATLRRDHVRVQRRAVLFSYPAKGGVPRTLELRDPLLYPVVNSLLRRRGGGTALLAYRSTRAWVDVTTADLNIAVRELVGDQYTCKDLRTWNATVLAAVRLAAGVAERGVPRSERARRSMVTAAMTKGAEHLGNTVAVARASYVDPGWWGTIGKDVRAERVTAAQRQLLGCA